MEQKYQIFNLWCEKATFDKDLITELNNMKHATEKIEDAFFRELEFGTGGLRGKIGAGTNRINVYTVARATAGLANYLSKEFQGKISVAIGYDTRIKSKLFAETAANVLAAKGISVNLISRPLPTPFLSYVVRKLCCQAGIMITASHNPAIYNGYKVYGQDGCQITTEAADNIYSEILKLDYFTSLPDMEASPPVTNVSEKVYRSFITDVFSLSLTDEIDKNLSIVYTPLNGTGLEPVIDILKKKDFQNITVVKEQASPDGTFPTCPFPNPELPEAMELGLDYARKSGADILLATDPDCDRVGVAVKDGNNYRLLTGNEVGILLLDYICKQKQEKNAMPENPVCVKTIVTTDLAEKIAANYGVKTINVLTGFKFIGEKIGMLESNGKKSRYLLGFEESCGYLSGTHARDKDGVNAALLICEMCANYKKHGISLSDRLKVLYDKYGYSLSDLLSYTFEGETGMKKMQMFMRTLREEKLSFGDFSVLETVDFLAGIDDLPKSDVLKFTLSENASLIVRPSGTEPKLKFYLSAVAEDENNASEIIQKLRFCTNTFVNNYS